MDYGQSSDIRHFIKNLREKELLELVVVPLLEAMKYRRINITPGPLEHGKDIIFQTHSPLDGEYFCSVVLKVGKLDGTVSSKDSVRNLFFQIEQSLDTPIPLMDGHDHKINRVYVITNNYISQQTCKSILGKLRSTYGVVQFIGIDKLLDHVNKYIPDLIESKTSKVASYIKKLFKNNFYVNNLQILGEHRKIPLHRCFTGGNVESYEDRLVTQSEGHSMSDFLKTHPRVLVVGGAGSGKSTLLQKLILELITDSEVTPKKEADELPIYLQLRYLESSDIGNVRSLIHCAERSVAILTPFRSTLGSIRGIVLFLDGLDEMLDASMRKKLITLLPLLESKKIAGKPITKCVVTSRTYAASRIKGFQSVYLRPFGRAEIEAFASRWFYENAELASSLTQYIVNRHDLQILASSPLMLTMMAIVFRGGTAKFPRSRTSIYERAIKLLIHKWDEERDLGFGPTEEESICFLMYLAYKLILSRKSGANDSIVREVYKTMEEEGIIEECVYTVEQAEDRYQRTGLLQKNSTGQIEFIHKSIKEFLSARYIFYLNMNEILLRHVLKEEWWNVVKFYFGIIRRLDKVDGRILQNVKKKPYLLLESIVEADRTPKSIRENIVRSIMMDLAKGKIRLDDEAIPLVNLLGDYIIEYMEELITLQGQKQSRFYIALNDVLSKRIDKESRSYLKKMYQLFTDMDLNEQQLSILARAYYEGKNLMSSKLLEDLYFTKQCLAIASELNSKSPDIPVTLQKRRLVDSMKIDIKIEKLVKTLRYSDSWKPEEEINDQKRHLDENMLILYKIITGTDVNPVGFYIGLSALCKGTIHIDEILGLIKSLERQWKKLHSPTSLKSFDLLEKLVASRIKSINALRKRTLIDTTKGKRVSQVQKSNILGQQIPQFQSKYDAAKARIVTLRKTTKKKSAIGQYGGTKRRAYRVSRGKVKR